MSLITARKKRTELYLSIAGLLVAVAGVSAISIMDPSGVSLRIGMVMVTVGAAMWLSWPQLLAAIVLTWVGPNFGRSMIEEYTLFNRDMLLELPGLLGVGIFASVARDSLRLLEQESMLIGSGTEALKGVNPETGLYDSSQLIPNLESELARSRRFGHTFSLVLVGIDEMRQKFDYRDETDWQASLLATHKLVQQTRNNVDKVFHHGASGYAMLLPESGEQDVPGMVRRLRRIARRMSPSEGEPGGPLPVHFGATFFPDSATTVEDLIRRAEVALRIAEKSTSRYQLDGAEAPELPPAETLRRADSDVAAAAAAFMAAQPAEPAVSLEAKFAEASTPEITLEESSSESSTVLESLSEDAPVADLTTAPAAPVFESLSYIDAPTQVTLEERGGRFVWQPGDIRIVSTPDEENSSPVEPGVGSDAEEPVAVAGGAPSTPALEEPADLEAMLKQMNETLNMIKSVRSRAA